jgi:hypothetical protein
MTQLGTDFGAQPGLLGALELTVDHGWTSAGGTAIVPARVTNPGSEPVRVVLKVQGLADSWCPPSQVLLLSPGHTADVFWHLRPALGTPPGRYLWAMTAQTGPHPMQAATTDLLVRREPPPVKPARRRSRRRPLVAVAAGLLAVITAGGLLLGRHHRGSAPSVTPRPVVSSVATPSSAPSPVPVALSGTILAGDVGPVTVTVVRLTLGDLIDRGHATGTPVKAKVKIKGQLWTTSLPAGVYAMTFSQKGFEPAAIVVDSTVLRWAPPPWVQLQPLAGKSPGKSSGELSGEQKGSGG